MTNHQPTVQLLCCLLACALIAAAGCGSTKTQQATEQLLMSDAVDRAVAQLDFRDLAGEKIYLDTQYVKSIKGIGFVNSDYIISSLRQQMTAADCRLQEKEDDAKYVVEARVGALGSDGHEVTYGIPASNALSNAAHLVPNAPAIPPLPEIALAKRENKHAAAKIAVFAYDRETRQPVWQSGIARSKSTAKDAYIFGAGPFQRGTIYEGTQFAGTELHLPLHKDHDDPHKAAAVAYDAEVRFPRLQAAPPAPIAPVGFEIDDQGARPKVLQPADKASQQEAAKEKP